MNIHGTCSRGMWNDVMDGVLAQPGRMFVSFLAIGVGMAALAVLFAALGGLREKAKSLVEDLGVNVVAVMPERAVSGLDERTAALLAANMPDCQVAAARFADTQAPGSVSGRLRVAGVDAAMASVRQWRIARGRFIDGYDVAHHARVAVVSAVAAAHPGWDVGQTLKLKDTLFQVVGVVETGGADAGESGETIGPLSGSGAVFVPITTARLLGAAGPDARRAVDAVFVRVKAGPDIDRVVRTISRIVGAPDVMCAVSCLTPDKLLAGIRKLERTILVTAGGIALLCVLLGGTTLASLMILNVRERKQEIGLRRAIGAGKADVAMLFVVEGILIAGSGAVIGILLGIVLLTAARPFVPIPLRVDLLLTVVAPLLSALVVGAVASYWPASLAASIHPSEALRSE